jgi:hypothetical protein
MTYTRIINDIKYLQLYNDNNFKSLSLEDNVYFTLRDIFLNISGCDYVMEANGFNSSITGDICYEDRKSDFQYTNVLDDKLFIDKLNNWLNYISKSDFDFEELDDKLSSDEEKEWYYDMKRLIKFDDWWDQLEDLKILIKTRLEEIKSNK